MTAFLDCLSRVPEHMLPSATTALSYTGDAAALVIERDANTCLSDVLWA